MKSVALVCASDFNASYFLSQSYDEIVAVDGGYAHLQAAGVAPTFALGDFDSLGYVPQGVPLITFPEEKDDSDLGLALNWCLEKGYFNVTVYGSFGGRLDHTLATLQTMMGFALHAGACIQGISNDERLVVMPSGCSLSISKEGQTPEFCALNKDYRTVSVIALTNQVEDLSIRGMKYGLEKGTLTNQCSLGLSNELVGEEAFVSVGSGCALVLLPLSQRCSFGRLALSQKCLI